MPPLGCRPPPLPAGAGSAPAAARLPPPRAPRSAPALPPASGRPAARSRGRHSPAAPRRASSRRRGGGLLRHNAAAIWGRGGRCHVTGGGAGRGGERAVPGVPPRGGRRGPRGGAGAAAAGVGRTGRGAAGTALPRWELRDKRGRRWVPAPAPGWRAAPRRVSRTCRAMPAASENAAPSSQMLSAWHCAALKMPENIELSQLTSV